MTKQNPMVCVFAHPDDEAFGPSGTITLESQQRDVYIIKTTDGHDPTNPSDDLVARRQHE